MLAPLAVKVAELPLQIVCELTVNTGFGSTVTVVVTGVAEQLALLPFKVYIVVAEGLTFIVLPVRFPGLQVYVLAPLAVKVAEFPLQIVAELTDSTGLGMTVTVAVTGVAEQLALLPFSVYIVVAAGLTVIMFPLKFPGLQL